MMTEIIYKEFYLNIHAIPDDVWNPSITFMIISSLILCITIQQKKSLKVPSIILLFLYLYIIFLYTLFQRGVDEGYNFIPFWSYKAIYDGQLSLVVDNVMNVLLFIPAGFLAGMAFPLTDIKYVVAGGFIISFGIEVIQYAFSKGFAEFDDVIHNTLGCVIGFGILKLIRKIENKIMTQ